MDFAKLSSNEKLAVYGSVAALVGGIVGGTVSALGWLALLAAIAMLAVVFLPQLSPTTRLPGSNGSLMLISGAVAGIIMVLALLTIIGVLGTYFSVLPLNAIFFLIGVVGAVVMAWAGWQEFQAEGGKFQIGTAGGPSAAPPPSEPTSPTAAPPPPPPSAPAAPDTMAPREPEAPPPAPPPTAPASTATAPPAGEEPMEEEEERRTPPTG